MKKKKLNSQFVLQIIINYEVRFDYFSLSFIVNNYIISLFFVLFLFLLLYFEKKNEMLPYFNLKM
jgi:hypothetical protein